MLNMKKILLSTILSMFMILSVNAQLTIAETELTISGPVDHELFIETEITNDGNTDLDLRWVRTINTMPEEWDNFFCSVPGVCGLPWTDSLNFVLPPSTDTIGLMQCHCDPHGITGMAEIDIDIIINENNEVLGTIHLVCDGVPVSTNELEQANIKLFPNPATENFQLINAQKVDQVVIYNILGKQVKSFARNEDDYYVGDLPKGLYLVQLMDFDTDATKTLKLKKS